MMETKRRPKRQRPRCQVYQEFRRKASDNLKKDEFKIRVEDYTLYRSKVRLVYRNQHTGPLGGELVSLHNVFKLELDLFQRSVIDAISSLNLP